MLIMGINGGCNFVHEDHLELDSGAMHDSAAALVEDGRVVAAVEQERIDRIKHSNKFPIEAMKACLDVHGAKVSDVDTFVYYTSKWSLDPYLKGNYLKMNTERRDSPLRFHAAEEFFRDVFRRGFDHDLPARKLRFVHHHVAHLVSAYAQSGFERALVVSIDGMGENQSGRVAVGEGREIETLEVIPVEKSLGYFYLHVIGFLGFKIFDEYKAMGLAPYGDPTRFRAAMAKLYDLRPNGDWAIRADRYPQLFDLLTPRKRSEPLLQIHQDLAAALQEAFENIVFHVLRHHQRATGHENLALAGGAAHNCTMNGKVAASGMFERVFVQPAAHDAGCALGAALSVYFDLTARPSPRPKPLRLVPRLLAAPRKLLGRALGAKPAPPARVTGTKRRRGPVETAPIEHVYWGADVAKGPPIADVLGAWGDFLDVERVDDVEARTAALLAAGSAVGWVQGRSEFGPRALGNRSIVADPRPAANKEIINAMVKKREGFRPFAPSVLEEDAAAWFDLTGLASSPYMIFVVPVQKDKRSILGAVTHVDGSARVQTVSRRTNPRYWRLIDEFKKLTGVPVVLNTSFNNNAEPIVETAEDGVVCFLTTKLNQLVVGDYLANKKQVGFEAWSRLVPTPLRHVKTLEQKRYTGSAYEVEFSLGSTHDKVFHRPITGEAFAVMCRADGGATLEDIFGATGVTDRPKAETLLEEMLDLWAHRLVALSPRRPA